MFTKKFITDIAASIEQFGIKQGDSHPSSFYNDLARKGLTGSKAFYKLSPADTTRITNIIKA